MAQHYHDTPYRPWSERRGEYSRVDPPAPPPARSGMGFLLLVLISVLATFYGVWQLIGVAEAQAVPQPTLQSSIIDRERASFSLCHEGGGTNCVVDGDTLYYRGQKIRIADIDTPETHEPRCAHKARLGNSATLKLHKLVNAGGFSLQTIDRDKDRFGRKLRILSRNGESIGGMLVAEGLARWYGNGRKSWC